MVYVRSGEGGKTFCFIHSQGLRSRFEKTLIGFFIDKDAYIEFGNK